MSAAWGDLWDVAVMRAGFKTQIAKDVAAWGCESAWSPGVESQKRLVGRGACEERTEGDGKG